MKSTGDTLESWRLIWARRPTTPAAGRARTPFGFRLRRPRPRTSEWAASSCEVRASHTWNFRVGMGMVPVQVTGNLQKNIAKRPMAATMTVSHCFTACGWLNIEHIVCCLQVKLLPGTGSLRDGTNLSKPHVKFLIFARRSCSVIFIHRHTF